MTDDTSAALNGALDHLQAFVDRDEYDVLGIDLDEARVILAHIAALEARAEKAEYELRRWKEVESNRPDWEKLWESESNRADEAEAREAMLREALAKIGSSSWSAFYVDSPAASIAAQIIDEMQRTAREAIDAALQPTSKGDE